MKFEPKVISVGNLRVILVKEDRASVTVRAMVGTGSREETDKEAGSAHFLEHYVFKGTKEFPGIFDINNAIEKVGGAFNAYTGQAEMGFWVKVDKDNLPLATKIVGQLVTEPLLSPEHFDKERGTILEELYMYEDRPNSKAMEQVEKLAYGKTNLGRPIIGTVKSLNGMTVEELRKYFEKWFVARNVIVGIVGDYGSEEKILKLIQKEFGKLIKLDREVPDKDVFVWDEQTAPRMDLTKRKTEQAAVAFTFRGIPIKDERKFALELINIVFGDSWMSRLIKEVREERGWAYAIRSGVDQYIDVGTVMVGAGLPKGKLKEAVDLIVEMATELADGKWEITKEELEIAKECFRGRLALDFDRPEDVLGLALENLMFEDKIYTPDQILKKTDAVTLKEARDLCKEIFKRENMSLAVVGNYKELPFEF